MSLISVVSLLKERKWFAEFNLLSINRNMKYERGIAYEIGTHVIKDHFQALQ